jgi:NADPH:quinone reductase
MASELPKTMRAAVIDAAGPPDAVHVVEVPAPRVIVGHVVIALDYASVGPWDTNLRAGAWGPVKRGTILGADGSGTIAAVASGVRRLRVGDRVYSYSYGNRKGFHAEYVSVRAERVEHAPPQLDQVVAGAMPCVALTALSGLRTLRTSAGQSFLVFGASGGVGSLAVWLGATMGATVTGTARPDAHEYVLALGAAHVVDPRSPARDAVVARLAPSGFDAALVTATGDGLAQLLSHLRPRAAFAYPNGVEPEPHVDGHPGRAFDAQDSRPAFARLNAAIGTRTIPLRTEVFPLDDVVGAHRRVEAGHVVGKVVLRIR